MNALSFRSRDRADTADTAATRSRHVKRLGVRRALALIAGLLLSLGSLIVVGGERAHACAKEISECAAGAAKFSPSLAETIRECKEVRRCRQNCRRVKRSCVHQARQDKRACKSDCKRRFGRGKHYRQCKRQCRRAKRSTKADCRQDKRVCRTECRRTYKTKACAKARFEAIKGGAELAVFCSQMIACLAE